MEKPVITQVDLPLSDRCNLNCSFCYTHGGHGNSFSQAHIDKCFDWMISQFNEGATEEQRKWGIRVTVYGGEPLLEWENLIRVIVEKKALGESEGVKFQFSLVTNMTLLTEEKLDWLIANNVGIHPSIDGCQPAQDMERKYKDGSGTSVVVYENARRLLSKVGGRSCRMTVAPSTVQYLYDSIVFMTKDIGFKTVNAVLAGGVEWTDEALEIHKQQIERVTDWWIQEMREGRHWSLYHLRNMFLGIWSGRRMRNLCASGISHLGIDTQGNFYPCHRFCNLDSRPEYLLGNLDTGFTNLELRETFRTYDLAVANKERCKDCPAVMGCHALCLHEMMLADNGMFEPCEHYCKVWPFYWKMAMRAHSILSAENNQLYFQTYDPRLNQRQAPRPMSSGTRMQGQAQAKTACSGNCQCKTDGGREMKVSVGHTVQYAIDKIDVKTVRVQVLNGKIVILTQFQWLDATGTVIRQENRRYTQDELLAVFTSAQQDASPLMTALVSLIPTVGSNQSLFISLVPDVFLFRGVWMTVDAQGKSVWSNKTYTGEELASAGLDINSFKGAISLLSNALTTF